jgi:hypothetical protein
MHPNPRVFALTAAASALTVSQALFEGCATMLDGPREQIHVLTQPAGAKVYLNGHAVDVTPVTLVVSRWGCQRLRIEMAGYEPVELPLEKHFNEYAGNNLWIGGVWIVVDALTGAIFRLDLPAKSRAELHPLAGNEGYPAIFSQTTLTISTSLKPVSGGQKIGQMEPQKNPRQK